MNKFSFIVALVAFSLFGPNPSWAGDESIEAFYGVYKGESTDDKTSGLKRDLSVKISPRKENGFTLAWETAKRNANGKIKNKKYKINFITTDRHNIFAAAMASNLFGKKTPLDPLKGDPYIWSRIMQKTLSTFVMLINADGGYEFQVYDRTLTDTGLDLSFSRIRDGKPLKKITAKLKKQDD